MKDTSLKNLKDVRAYTQMSILGSIPLLENDFVVRRRKRLCLAGLDHGLPGRGGGHFRVDRLLHVSNQSSEMTCPASEGFEHEPST